jgi:hypothetical protein
VTLCTTTFSIIIVLLCWVSLCWVSFAEFHYAEFHYAEFHYAEFHYTEFHYAECHLLDLFAECHYAECHYAKCRHAECHYAECHLLDLYAECHYAECRHAECHYAECHLLDLHAECHYAECRYVECRGADKSTCLVLVQISESIYSSIHSESTIFNGREPKGCLGRVYNNKLGSFASREHTCMAHMQPFLELKTFGPGFVLLTEVWPWHRASVNWSKVRPL